MSFKPKIEHYLDILCTPIAAEVEAVGNKEFRSWVVIDKAAGKPAGSNQVPDPAMLAMGLWVYIVLRYEATDDQIDVLNKGGYLRLSDLNNAFRIRLKTLREVKLLMEVWQIRMEYFDEPHKVDCPISNPPP